MGSSKNMVNRRKINAAIGVIVTPFSSVEMSRMTGIPAKRVSALLRDNDRVKKSKVNRNRGGVRVIYNVVPV